MSNEGGGSSQSNGIGDILKQYNLKPILMAGALTAADAHVGPGVTLLFHLDIFKRLFGFKLVWHFYSLMMLKIKELPPKNVVEL